MRHRTARTAVATIAAAALLSGCTPVSAYAIFDRAPTPADQLPAGIPDSATSSMDLETVRYAGEHEGASLWLAREDSAPGVCLLVHVDNTDWAGTCGGTGGPISVSGQTWTFSVVPDAHAAPAGYTEVAENVYAPPR